MDAGSFTGYGETRGAVTPLAPFRRSDLLPAVMTPTTPTPLWGDHDLPAPGAERDFSIGALDVRMRRVKNELWIAHRRRGPEGGEADDARWEPEDSEWSRWALRDEELRLRLLPALPDRVLVVKVEQPFTLLSGADARVYSRVAAWVRVQVVGSDGKATDLTEIPIERLSDTWWGDFRAGQPGYWLATRARRELPTEGSEPWLIVCTLQLTNTSEDDLPVEKLALRVEHLAIFGSDDRLFAEEVTVEYLGEDEGSDIDMTGRPPREADGAERIAPARRRTGGFRTRTFAKLKSLSPFGMGG